jgi:hypothetical protein
MSLHKIVHALTDAHGLPLELVLTPGQLVASGHGVVLADKAYDADWLLRRIEAAGALPNIPETVHLRWKPLRQPSALPRAQSQHQLSNSRRRLDKTEPLQHLQYGSGNYI